MPRRADLHKILVIGSGPIVIGQANEFDYSGTQACKALRAEGYRIVLCNSNPATIMTDPDFADRTYIEPLTLETLQRIIERERPDAILPTVGGQTALNLAMLLDGANSPPLIGARREAIERAESRERFREVMIEAGLAVPRSATASSLVAALAVLDAIGLPCIVRPSFTLGGSGGGLAADLGEFEAAVRFGLAQSPVSQVLIEQSVAGWKEFELEVMRDRAGNFSVICSIENVDPMGVHTGDSITVAPAQTLSDREYQAMRDDARRVIEAVGVETGGANIQFAVHPSSGERLVIEMNPRVSRSSALASKATGFPIAKIAALLAVGYTLDEIQNDITRVTPASFEPSLDYVVVKIPRWAFEKFPGAIELLGPQMQSVGEVMALAGTFREALDKALRSLEKGYPGLLALPPGDLSKPTPDRLLRVYGALSSGVPVSEVAAATGIDRWFLHQLLRPLEPPLGPNARRVFRRVDTCAGEFEAHTPYLYSTHGTLDEARPTDSRKVAILGAGPARIGQGIEFDYCCVHGAFALRSLSVECIMINNNPETVSTDYDTSDRLYFEPLTLPDVLAVMERERPEGVILQFGGQTPLNLARGLASAGVPILGTSVDATDLAEDRARFGALLKELGIPYPTSGMASSLAEARGVAARIGYPVLVRPSYVLGGRAMGIVYDEAELAGFFEEAFREGEARPVQIDRFLEDAYEFDVDAVSDGRSVVICGILQHIEEAGIHSGDSAMSLPAYMLTAHHEAILREYVERLALELGVVGLLNVQLAIKDGIVYVLEANPRASRTVPFVAKATGVPWVKVATEVILGASLDSALEGRRPDLAGMHYVKEVTLPFIKFEGVDILLSPEMRSTGECMGIGRTFGEAFAKAQEAVGAPLPLAGTVLVSVNDRDKGSILKLARDFLYLGFSLLATPGTAAALRQFGLPVEEVSKGAPLVALIESGQIQLVVNTPLGQTAHSHGRQIRRAALESRVPCLTTLSAAAAAIEGIRALRAGALSLTSLQELRA